MTHESDVKPCQAIAKNLPSAFKAHLIFFVDFSYESLGVVFQTFVSLRYFDDVDQMLMKWRSLDEVFCYQLFDTYFQDILVFF